VHLCATLCLCALVAIIEREGENLLNETNSYSCRFSEHHSAVYPRPNGPICSRLNQSPSDYVKKRAEYLSGKDLAEGEVTGSSRLVNRTTETGETACGLFRHSCGHDRTGWHRCR